MPHPEAAIDVIHSEVPPSEPLSLAQKERLAPFMIDRVAAHEYFSDAPEEGTFHLAVMTYSGQVSLFLDRDAGGSKLHVGTTNPNTGEPRFFEITTGDRALKEGGSIEPRFDSRKGDSRNTNTMEAVKEGRDLIEDVVEWMGRGHSVVVKDRVESLREDIVAESQSESVGDEGIVLEPDQAVQMHLPTGELVAAGQ